MSHTVHLGVPAQLNVLVGADMYVYVLLFVNKHLPSALPLPSPPSLSVFLCMSVFLPLSVHQCLQVSLISSAYAGDGGSRPVNIRTIN